LEPPQRRRDSGDDQRNRRLRPAPRPGEGPDECTGGRRPSAADGTQGGAGRHQYGRDGHQQERRVALHGKEPGVRADLLEGSLDLGI
jgi:hypothetical protein